MISAERTEDPAHADLTDCQSIHNVSVVAALKRIADGVESLTDEVRRLVQGRVGSDVIDVNRTYSRAEAARLLNVSTRTVDRRIRDGAVRVIKTKNTVRVEGASLDSLGNSKRERSRVDVLKL